MGGFLHYPRETPHKGYCTPTFGGTDETVQRGHDVRHATFCALRVLLRLAAEPSAP